VKTEAEKTKIPPLAKEGTIIVMDAIVEKEKRTVAGETTEREMEVEVVEEGTAGSEKEEGMNLAVNGVDLGRQATVTMATTTVTRAIVSGRAILDMIRVPLEAVAVEEVVVEEIEWEVSLWVLVLEEEAVFSRPLAAFIRDTIEILKNVERGRCIGKIRHSR